MKVLVIEDDPQGRRLLIRVLERAGCDVVAVENGLAAFGEVRTSKPAAILCDICLPYMGGRTFYGELVAEYPDLAKQVIFLTGAPEPDVVQLSEQSGCPLLIKPYDVEDLVATVRRVGQRKPGEVAAA